MDGDSGPGRELVYLRTADHDYDLATVACARAHNAALESNRRHGIPSPEASPSSSSSRGTAGVEEKDSGMVSSNDLGPMISDTSKFKTLSLNDSPPTLDSTDRAVVHSGDMGIGLPDSTIMAQPAAEEAYISYDVNDHTLPGTTSC